jgi:hypothetical protein
MSAAHRGSHPGGAAASTQQQPQQPRQPAFTASEVFRGTSLGDAFEAALFELEDARQFPDSVHDFAMRAFDQVLLCLIVRARRSLMWMRRNCCICIFRV